MVIRALWSDLITVSNERDPAVDCDDNNDAITDDKQATQAIGWRLATAVSRMRMHQMNLFH